MVDTMNEYVRMLTDSLEPLIMDLDDRLKELKSKKERMESVSRFLAYVNGDVNLVGIYADQNLIIDNLDNINSNKEEYKASCYLLRSEEESVKSLPQYKEANMYILGLINYFKITKTSLVSEIGELERVCHDKTLEKKYYEIFNEPSPFVSDVNEFMEFLDKHAISDDERINLLIYTIKSNVSEYKKS